MEMEMDRVHNKPQHTGWSELHTSHDTKAALCKSLFPPSIRSRIEMYLLEFDNSSILFHQNVI